MNNENEKTFEDLLNELNLITKTLQEGGISLDKSIELFNRGTEIVKLLQERLRTAEEKIENIVHID